MNKLIPPLLLLGLFACQPQEEETTVSERLRANGDALAIEICKAYRSTFSEGKTFEGEYSTEIFQARQQIEEDYELPWQLGWKIDHDLWLLVTFTDDQCGALVVNHARQFERDGKLCVKKRNGEFCVDR